jgi:hypothetical protein
MKGYRIAGITVMLAVLLMFVGYAGSHACRPIA